MAAELVGFETDLISVVDGTFKGGVVKFYVDGVFYPGNQPSYNPGFTFTTTATIGALVGIGNNHSFWGKEDEVSIYRRALSASEILATVTEREIANCSAR